MSCDPSSDVERDMPRNTQHTLGLDGLDASETRRVSAALFGNEKLVEVVLGLVEEGGLATAQQVARRLTITHATARQTLVRLAAAGMLRLLPKSGSTRSEQYYEAVEGNRWHALVALAAAVAVPEAARRARPG